MKTLTLIILTVITLFLQSCTSGDGINTAYEPECLGSRDIAKEAK